MDIIDKTIEDLEDISCFLSGLDDDIRAEEVINAIKVIEQLRDMQLELHKQINVMGRHYGELLYIHDKNRGYIPLLKTPDSEDMTEHDEEAYLKGQNYILDELKRFIKQNDLRDEQEAK